jgi:flagellar FliL protein
MANNRDEDLNDDEEAVKPPSKGKKGVIKWILIGVGLMTLIGVSVGTSIYFMKTMISGQTVEKSGAQNNSAKGKEEKGKPKEVKVPIYYKFDPPFVVNLEGQSGSRFLQLTIELMTYDQSVTADIEQHMPVIRNNIVFLLSSVTYEQLSTLEGKQKLRADLLSEIQKVLKEKTGKPGVEEVYLTSLVMQ